MIRLGLIIVQMLFQFLLSYKITNQLPGAGSIIFSKFELLYRTKVLMKTILKSIRK